MSPERELRIDITNNDIRQAKVAWLTAWESDAPNDRVSDLYEDYAGLVSAQTQQLSEGAPAQQVSDGARAQQVSAGAEVRQIADGGRRTRPRLVE